MLFEDFPFMTWFKISVCVKQLGIGAENARNEFKTTCLENKQGGWD